MLTLELTEEDMSLCYAAIVVIYCMGFELFYPTSYQRLKGICIETSISLPSSAIQAIAGQCHIHHQSHSGLCFWHQNLLCSQLPPPPHLIGLPLFL